MDIVIASVFFAIPTFIVIYLMGKISQDIHELVEVLKKDKKEV